MAFATARTVSLHGAIGHLVDVQTDVSPGQVGLTLVGRPDVTLNEARDRCRMAIVNSRLDWPATRRITVLLSPADLIKSGTHFDLAIAVSVLAAAGGLPAAALSGTVFIGELTLDGGLRSVPGVLPMVLAASARGVGRVFVPEPHAQEAAMVPGMEVIGVRSLAQVVAELRGDEIPEAPPVAPMSGSRLLSWRGAERREELDMADLFGLEDTRYAVEVAAAGGHHLMLSGPKGAGKTSIAERIPGILPDLTPEESLELTAIHSLAGALEPGDGLVVRPPYSAPHHDASKASLLGGGLNAVRPGELSRAHAGVLFLDEFPLFRSDVIEALRQPLESGEVTVARRDESVTLPARGMVVLACNPCPCGEYAPQVGKSQCQCKETQRRDYRARITGPVADRIDILRHVVGFTPGDQRDRFERRESSAEIRVRVEAARRRQARRYAGCSWRLNGQASAPALRDRWPVTPAAQALVDDETWAGRLTQRGAVRVLRLAWSVADLAGLDQPDVAEVNAALALRTGAPLMVDVLSRRVG
ncbi:YifB family Mg chelatase-like AAA ATPase [Nocardioides panaciterrulae]|uniref:Magnesium chelatase family protein n=1 Tax=Nocardioides panaciterrulae TaxID=661492 RepID=A0A7Y9JCN0_9ACTN|nr:YifB family Mg chelatase-like AAA ATPase [Nocardioides panaciterrulae]NYD42414.1 magnesium chelatase family protein [Nocardioides panaciterrulae]